MAMTVEEFKLAFGVEPKTRDDGKDYFELIQRVEAQLEVLTALRGETHVDSVYLREGLKAAKALVADVAPKFTASALYLVDIAKSGVERVSRATEAYASQREREKEVESARQKAVKLKLSIESAQRILEKDINALAPEVATEQNPHIPAITQLVKNAQEKNRAVSQELADVDLAQVVKGVVNSEVLQRANLALSRAETTLKAGRKDLNDAQSQYDKALNSAETDPLTKDLFNKCTQLNKKINDEQRGSPGLLLPLITELHLVRSRLVAAIVGTEEHREAARLAAGLKINSIEPLFNEIVEKLDREYTAAFSKAEAVQNALGELTDIALPSTTITFSTRLKDIRAKIENSEYETAVEEATRLLENIQREQLRIKPFAEAWAIKIVGLQSKIDAQQEQLLGLKPPHEPKTLSFELLTLQTSVEQRSIDYPEAVGKLEEWIEKLHANSQFLAGRQGIGPALDEWSEKVQTALSAVERSLLLATEKLTEVPIDVQTQVLLPFRERQQTLQESWESTRLTLTLADQDVVVSILADLDGLNNKILVLDPTSEAGEKAIKEGDLADARKKIKELAQACEDNLLQLRHLGADSYDADCKTVAQAIKKALEIESATVMREHIEDLSKLLSELQARVIETTETLILLKVGAAEARDEAKVALANFIETVNGHNSGLLGAMRRLTNLNTKSEYQAYVKVLEQEFSALEPLVDGEFSGLLIEATEGFAELTRHIQDAKKGLIDEKIDEGGEQVKTSLSALKHKIEAEVKRVTENKNVKARTPAAAEDLSKRLLKLKTELGTILLSDSQKSFTTMVEEGTKLIERARLLSVDVAIFVNKAKDVKKRLDSPTEPVSAFPTVAKDLKSKVESALKNAEIDGGLEGANQELSEVEAALLRSQSGGDMAAMVRELDGKTAATTQAKTEWEGALKAFDDEFYTPFQDAIKSEMSPGARFFAFFKNPEKIKEIKDLRSLATKSADKADYQMASFQLSLARNRMEFHIKYPEGSGAARLADVGKVKRSWRSAVEAYKESLTTVSDAIAEEIREGGEEESATVVLKNATTLKSLLSSDIFDGIVDGLAKGVTVAEKRQYREAGLAQVRELRATLAHPWVRALADHPFKAPAFSGHFAIGKSLLDIEKTILLSIEA